MLDNLIIKIEENISLGVNLFFISTYEEDRCEAVIKTIAKNINYDFELWHSSIKPHLEPVSSLNEALIKLYHYSNKTIWFGKDLHHFWNEPKTRRLIEECISQGKTLIIAHPFSNLPKELLLKGISLTLPLPDLNERKNIINNFSNKSGILLDQINFEELIKLTAGLTYNQITRIFKKIINLYSNNESFEQISLMVLEEKKESLNLAGLLEPYSLETDISEVGGLDELKTWINIRKNAFNEGAANFGLPPPKGLMITGVQGCGKSLFAKSFAKLWHLPLLRMDFNSFFASGSPEASLQYAIQIAELNAPVVLWIDEIDKFFSSQQDSQLNRVMAKFLTWLQEKTMPVFIIATANNVDKLPPELVRRGRFDEIFFVDLPDIHEREEIIKVHLQKRKKEPKYFDLKKLSQLTEYYTGSEIEQIIISSLFRAYAESRDLTQNDIEKEIKNIVPLYFTFEESIKSMREWAKRRARFATPDRKKLDLFEKGS